MEHFLIIFAVFFALFLIYILGSGKRKEEKIKKLEEQTGVSVNDLKKETEKVNENEIAEPVFMEHFIDRD